MTRLLIPILVLAVCAGVSWTASSYAQTNGAEVDSAVEDPCLARPDDEALPDQQAQVDGGEVLSEQLDRCNGVLRPPAVGEGEMVEPPPDVGNTPIIRPDDLPKQQPGPEGHSETSTRGG